MDLSGIIFVVLALAWAVYLIPKALKHHDEIARTRSIDRFSTAMRVLARREPVSGDDARLVVTPARPVEQPRPSVSRQAGPGSTTPAAARPTAPARLSARRAAARAAARRRRRVTLALVVLDLATTVLAAFAVVPWWPVAVPLALTFLYLALCRRQVRREQELSWTRDLPEEPHAPSAEVAPRRAIRIDAPHGVVRTRATELSADEDTVSLSAVALSAAAAAGSLEDAELAASRAVEMQTVAVTVDTVDGGSLWDPLPVTLPTYVGKAKAARTVRTIDLGAPGTWTSGRTVEDSRLVEETVAAQEESAEEVEAQRAVGG